MKKSTHAPLLVQFKKMTAVSFVLAALISLGLFQDVQAQCSLACNKNSQISLNEICDTEVTPDMILNASNTSCPGGDFVVTVSKKHGQPIPSSPFVNKAHINQTLVAEVRDVNSGNRCWGEILVEDKMPPRIECRNDTLFCYEMRNYAGPLATDNCQKAAFLHASEIHPWFGGPFYNDYTTSMDAVFGEGMWDDLTYESLNPEIVFSKAYCYIYMEGSDRDAIELDSFLRDNRTRIEQWVADGGRLFLNAAPTEGGNINFGFGGVILNSNSASSISEEAFAVDPKHPIIQGPSQPVGSEFTSAFDVLGLGRVLTCPPGMNSILQNIDDNDLLVEKSYGDGHVLFGGMVPSNGWLPQPHGRNLKWNMLSYLKNMNDDVTLTLLNEVITPINCDEEFVKRVLRTYYAVDESGNESQPCTQEIVLRRFPHEEAFGPDDFSVAEGNPLMCQTEFELDGQGNPHPNVTGVPMVDAFRLWPSRDFYCNLNVTYSDVVLPVRGCVTSIMRLWSIREWWCSTEEVTTFTQVIEIVDNQGPEVTVPRDMTVTTTGRFTCEAIVNLPLATVFDSCSGNNVTVDVQFPGGFLQNQNGGQVRLPVGENEIVYTAYDACYNSTSEVMLVTVEDNTAPVAICDKNTVVGLTYDGFADVYAHTFDDGSYDDCWIDSMAVKRMDDGEGCGIVEDEFGPFVTFCCDDIAEDSITVILKVWDENGNSNECMVLIEVQDKLRPVITCPPHLTISCDYHLDRQNLDVFGTVVESKDDQEDIEISPPFLLDWDGLLIDGLAHDNCQIEIFEEETFDISQCNVGTITRVFIAEDPNGFAECTQTITILNSAPFDVNTDVVWPLDYETDESCDVGSLQPDALPDPFSEPIITEDRCDLVGATFSDEVFPFAESNACFKIIRTWKIIDWCQFNLGSYSEWTYQQIIKVHNTVAPEILSSCDPDSAETFDPDCEEGFIELVAVATDDCTPDDELMWTFEIDSFNNGIFDLKVSGIGDTIDASGPYPVGTHQIKYSFEDRCGNKVSCTQEFSIINRKAPTVYCQNGIVVDLMPVDLTGDGKVDDGMVEIWAEDFDAGSTHSCGYELTFSFDSLGLELARIYDCDSLAAGPELEVTIYITDEVGNQGSCNNLIVLQDNQGACVNNITSAVIGGLVATESNTFVSEVAVELHGSGVNPLMTKNDGAYAFPAMPHGGNYTVAPGKQDDHMNGVSTADLIIIQRHLLGYESLDSPYKLIAADANNSGDISVRDIIELRKLILGLHKELPSSPSWRFIDNAHTFMDPANPFAEKWPENYEIKGLKGHMMNVDFVGVKIGDVNGSAKANAIAQPQTRDNNKLKLVVDDITFKAGDIIQVPVFTSEAITIDGYQFTLNYNSEVLQWVDFQSGQIALHSAHFGLSFTDRGLVTTSWNGETTPLLTENALFSLTFRALRDGNLGELLLISSDITSAEAYTNGGVDTRGLQLEVRNPAATTNGLTLYQNTPNPFADETTIRFHLGQSEGAVLTIFDVNGKALYTRTITGTPGINEITVQADELPGSGVLYYQVDTKTHRATKRMILLK